METTILMDWERFSFNYRLNQAELASDLVKIEAYREAVLNLVLPSDWRQQLDRLNRVRAVYGTTALEGNPLSEQEVSVQMELMVDPPKTRVTQEQQQIRNSGLAQDWVRLRFTPDTPKLDLNDILRMHHQLTEGSDEHNNVPGRLRTHPVVVGTPALGGVHKGAPAERLEELMTQFLSFVNSREQIEGRHPVIRALVAHFFLITIHPFGDGNGRVSRLVEAGILFQGGYNVHGFYGLSNYFYRNGDEYKITLQMCRGLEPFDVTPFVGFGVKGFAQELKGINNFIKTKLNRIVYRDTLLRAFNKKASDRRRVLNQREFSLLDYLLEQTEPTDPFSERPSRQMRLEELHKSAFIGAAYKDVTWRTFVRELMRLAELGFIRFTKADGIDGAIVELDFEAIGKH